VVVTDSVTSPGLAGNVLGDATVRRVLVYLPPSYRNESARRYPVLYLLHGVTSVPDEWVDGSYQGLDLRIALDSLVQAGTIPEFIVVMPDANNRLQADWYANSPVMGNWQDFIVRDVVAHIDERYRTEARFTRRALVGHSMGGFGALAIAFTHPDVFTLERWQDASPQLRIHLSLAAALDGNPVSPRLFDELPFSAGPDGTVVAHPAVQARWLARMPPDQALAMVRRGQAQPVIHIEAGSEEADILASIGVLRDRLDSLHIVWSDTTFVGGHIDRVRERFTLHMLPAVGTWFNRERETMDFRFDDGLPILRRTPAVLRELLMDLPADWTGATEGPGTWSPFDVVGHLIQGESTDWVPRVEHLLRHGDSLAFPPFDREAMFDVSRGRSLSELIETFHTLRSRSLNRLAELGLTDADLKRRGRHPDFGEVTLGQHLATWVAHDLGHIRQIVRTMARQYTEAVGPWRAYLPILGT
jgi:pimeloyl-ACP methyl ester carboxylesterase